MHTREQALIQTRKRWAGQHRVPPGWRPRRHVRPSGMARPMACLAALTCATVVVAWAVTGPAGMPVPVDRPNGAPSVSQPADGSGAGEPWNRPGESTDTRPTPVRPATPVPSRVTGTQPEPSLPAASPSTEPPPLMTSEQPQPSQSEEPAP